VSYRYEIKYGPEIIDVSETLADAKDKRRYLLGKGYPSSLYIYRPTDQKRWF
jgi:hypothetical protein